MSCKKSNFNFIEKFLSVVNSYPENTAFEIEGTGISYKYKECLDKIELWKGYFETLNLKQGDKVLLLLTEGIDFIVSFYALASIGVISACVDDKMTDFELNQILEDFEPIGIIASNNSYREKKNLVREDKSVKFILVTDMKNNDYSSFEAEPVVFDIHSLPQIRKKLISPDNNYMISCHYTYKGLGYPLQIRHSCGDYSTYLQNLGGIYPQKLGGVHLVCLPFYTIYGIATVLFPFTYGCKILQVQTPHKKNILDLLITHNVSFTGLVPALIKKLVLEAGLEGDKAKRKINPELLVVTGGSYLKEAVQKEIQDLLNINIYQGYGLTETLPITFNYPGRSKTGTLGVPLSNVTNVAIVDCSGKEVLNGDVGEIAVNGLTVSESYYDKPDETKQFFHNKYFYTGDIAFKDRDNFLHYIGRKLPITKIVSKMVDLREVENILKKHHGVKRAKVIVRENAKYGELLHGLIEVEENESITKKELKNLCKKFLSRYKIPSKITVY